MLHIRHTTGYSMVDNARNSMKADHKPGFRDLTETNFMSARKRIMSVTTRDMPVSGIVDGSMNSMDMDDTTKQDDEDDQRSLNYQMLLIMHADSEMRPCRPILRVVSLPAAPITVLNRSSSSPTGSEMVLTCQLGDISINGGSHLDVESRKILCVYCLSLTDSEASLLINKVSQFNTIFFKNQTTLSERSNMALVPVLFHNTVPIGPRCIDDMQNVTSATDVQVAIITIMQSIHRSRSLSLRISRLHPYLATPENLHEAISIFMRKLDVTAFKTDLLKFSPL
jgi:hypothetical protein